MSQPEPEKPLRWTAGGIALLVLGLLILVPSGLCTVFLGIPNLLFNPMGVGLVLLIGGPPIAIGAALVYAALRLRRRD